MNILIVGGGAIGTMYGASLSRAADSVTFFVRRADQAADINAKGVRIVTPDGGAEAFALKAVLDVTPDDYYDLILFSTKVYDLSGAFEKVRPCVKPGTILMSIQNGVQHYDLLRSAYPGHIAVGGISYSGLSKVNNTDVLNTGPFNTFIGDNDGAINDVLHKVEALFRTAGMTIKIRVPIKEALWEKQVLTSMQQAPGALSGFTFKQMHDSTAMKALARQLYEEVVAVAAAEGVALAPDTYERVLKNWGNKPVHRPSMALDFQNGRQTEVHMAHGYIAELAEKHGLCAPVNRALYNLIRAIEENRRAMREAA